MNVRKKKELLSLIKQYKSNTGRKLNQAQQNLQKIVNDKLKQLNIPVKVDPSINTGKYALYKKIYDKNIKKQIKSIVSLMFDTITLQVGLVTRAQNNYVKIVLQYDYTYSTRGEGQKVIYFEYKNKKWSIY